MCLFFFQFLSNALWLNRSFPQWIDAYIYKTTFNSFHSPSSVIEVYISFLSPTPLPTSSCKRVVNAEFPGCWRHMTGYVAILVGATLTLLIQSSSVLTSALTPLVGLGAVHLERMYPVILGANLGTTMTGMLAALASDPASMRAGVRLALSHLLFNLSGILLWYPWPPSRQLPLSAARAMGNTVARWALAWKAG